MRIDARLSRAWAWAAAVAVLLLGAPLTAQADDGGPKLVGHLTTQAPFDQTATADGVLILNPSSRRLYQVFDTNRQAGRTRLQVYDLDTLKFLSTITLPISLAPRDSGRSGIPHAVDEKNARLLFPYYNRALSDLAVGGVAGLAGVLVVDERTGGVTDQQAPQSFVASGIASPLGASWSAHEGRLYILGRTVLPKPCGSDFEVSCVQEGGVAGLPTTVVVRWNPDKPAAQVASDPLGFAEAVRPVRACRRALPSELLFGRFQATILSSPTEPSVWVACSTASLGFQLIRLDRNQLADAQGTEEVYPGPEKVRSSLADATSERFFARYVSGGEVWWVFDARKRAWVGRIGGSTAAIDDVAAGLDTGTGRLFLSYPGQGLLRADARRQEVPQADRFPNIDRTGPGSPIVVDPKTRRIFFRGAPNRYDVYLDEAQIVEPPADDPDARTTDVEEEAGKTDAGFAAVARSYGSRALLIGGLWGLAPPDQFGTTRGLLLDTGSACGPREREVAVGLVSDSNLGSSNASASAHALKTDDASKQDLASPSRCDLNPGQSLASTLGRVYPPGLQRFPDPSGEQNSNLAKYLDRTANPITDPDTLFGTADCSGDQGKRYNAPRQPLETVPAGTESVLAGTPVHGLEAQVNCEQSKAVTSASAGGSALEIKDFPAAGFPSVRVASSTSLTNEFRDKRRGIVSQSHALARGISIGETPAGPLVSIDAVESWAEAAANGRKRGASRQDTSSARYTRRIAGVTVRNVDGDVVFTCGDCTRDALTAQQNMNQALAGRAEIRLPMPDARLIEGTPGGYQAAVQKDALQIRADTALNNDSSFQVPGLEIVSSNDDPNLRSRQIVQLAGVAAASSYGIYELGGAEVFGFGSLDSQEQGPLPAGVDVVSSATDGTTVYESATSGPPPTLGSAPSGGSLPARIVRSVARGAMLYVRRPREALLAACVWLALLAPLFAFARRRELVRSLTSQ